VRKEYSVKREGDLALNTHARDNNNNGRRRGRREFWLEGGSRNNKERGEKAQPGVCFTQEAGDSSGRGSI